MISVLHVDDEPAFLELTRAYLELQKDIMVDGAPSSLEAIEMLKVHCYDVVVADFQMPGMDGLKLLSHVRNRYGEMPFILFTGKGREEVVIQALNQGADFYLQKGGAAKAQFAELAHKIRQAVEKNKKTVALQLAEFSVEQATIMTLWSDERGRIIKANMEATRHLGYSSSELESMALWDIDPNFTPTILEQFWAELASKKRLVQDSIMRRKDGTLSPVRFVANYLEVNGHRYNFAFGWDITDSIKTEQALRESQERYRSLADNLPDFIFIVDRGGVVRFVNDALAKRLSQQADVLVGKSLDDIFPPPMAKRYGQYISQVIGSGEALRMEVNGEGDEQMEWVDIILVPSKDASGQVVEVIGTARDISSIKQAEIQLATSAASYKSLAESLPGLIYRVHLRDDDRLQLFNDPMPITGYTANELGPDLKYMGRLMEQADRALVQAAVEEAVRQGNSFEVEYRICRKGGENLSVIERGRPIQGSDGLPLYIDGVIFDVSKRRQAEESVRASERKFRELADLLPALVFECDVDGHVSFINETALTMVGYQREDAANGLSIYDIISEPDRPRAMSDLSRVMQGHSCDGAGFELTRKRGGSFPATIHCAPMHKDGVVTGIRGLFVDVSALRQSERMREATNVIAQAAISDTSLEEMYAKIHDMLQQLMPLDNFFIALFNEEKDELTFPYFKDERDPTPEPRRRGRGITEYVLHSGLPLHRDALGIEEMVRRGEIELIGTPPVDFIGVPLLLKGKTIGLMAAQSYRPEVVYSPQQLDVLCFVSGQVAMAIERKRQEVELKRYVGLLKTTFESTDDGLLIVDRDGHTLAFNERFVEMWCIPESIMRTKEDQRMIEFVLDQVAEPEIFLHKINELYQKPTETSMDLIKFKDRRFFERYSQPFYLDNEIVGRIWSFRDVTERTWAEEALNKSERELKYIINSAKDAIFVKDQVGKYVMANEALGKLFHIAPGEIQGKADADIFGEEAARYNELKDQQVLAGNTVEEEVTWSIDGVPHTFSVIKVPLRDETGWVFGICGIARDTTERKRVEKALKDANESLNLLSSITRHDVLNQLMVIRGYSDLVRSALKDQKLLDYMDRVERATRNIRQQIIFTRDFQRLGVVAPRWQPVEELLDRSLTTLEADKVDISVDLGGLELYGDPMLEKVFYNLLDNTLRHSEKATRISVTCQRRGSDLMLTYEDDGNGVPEDDKERIFDRGFGKNTGLGLFLVRLILEVTNIKVRECGEYGRGAKFELLVPDGAYRFREWDDAEREA